MRKRIVCGFALLALLFVSASARAQSGPLSVDPSELTLTGAVDQGPMAASLRLMAEEPVGEVQLFASDLADVTGDGGARDPIPASAVTLLPAAQFDELAAGSLTQVVVQVSPPNEAGTYAGALTIRWNEPSRGELVVPLTVVARTRPNLALLDSAQVTVAGHRGGRVSRQVTLRETVGGSPLTGLEAIPQDLRTADGERVLPAAALSLALPADRIEGQGLLTAELAVDLRGASAGAYSGQVHFVADDGNFVALPVTVNVKARPFLPILVLFLGAVLGIGLAIYRDRGKPRDRLILRTTAVRRAMESDDELEAGFGPRLRTILREVEAHVREEQWEKAREAVAQAEAMVRKWEGEAREEWIKQLTYLREELLPRLDEDGEVWTLRELRAQAEDVQRTAADFKGPAELRDHLLDIKRALERYERLRGQLKQIATVRMNAQFPRGRGEAWRRRELALGQRLNRLLPDDEGWDELEDDIRALAQEIDEARAAPTLEVKDATRGLGEAWGLGPSIDLRLPPQVRAISIDKETVARWRLTLNRVLAYGLGGLVLAATGFSTLYLANPTFGAEPVSDYLALLAWGLGAQTTFASAVDLLQGFGVPFGGGGSAAR